jgi:hypothetical protein
LDYALP